MGRKKRLEKKIAAQQAGVQQAIEALPTYQIPEETRQLMDLYGETAGTMTGLGQEVRDIAQQRTGMAEAPGAGLARQDIRSSTAGAVQNILEAGGGGAGAMAAIASARRGETEAMQGLASQNQMFQDQATRDLQQAMMQQAQIAQTGAQLEGAGLQTMIGQRGQQFQSELGKAQTQAQYQIGQLGSSQQQLQDLKNRRAQIAGGIIGGVTGIGSALLTGGLLGGK